MATSITSQPPQLGLSPGSNFADAFWDDQNKGVEIILSRLRKSKDTCEEIKKLYESRASIEQDYGTRLLKLAQNLRIGEFEEDSFAETLSRIPSALETTARAHIDLAQQLKDHLESPLDGFLRDQRDIRKMQQQQIENAKQLKKLHEADVTRAKEYYQIECTKLISLEKYYFSLSKEATSTDEFIKMEKEIEEQRRMVTVAEQVYKRSVDNFNSVNEKWVNDWAGSANKFQEMEFKRVTYLRSTLWSFANMMTSTFSIDEECCDRIRTALEITDVQKDITGFVQRYGTGNRIPGPLVYEILHQPTPIHITIPNQSSVSSIKPVVPAAIFTAPKDDKQQSLSVPLSTSTSTLDITESTRSESAPVISTNPDEELKSVDRQLEQVVQSASSEDEELLQQTQQLDVPPQTDSADPLTALTDQSNNTGGPILSAFKEVEQILNRPSSYDDAVAATPTSVLIVKKEDTIDALKTRTVASNRASYASNTQTIPPIMMARSIHSDALQSPVSPRLVNSEDLSSDVYNALGINSSNQIEELPITANTQPTTNHTFAETPLPTSFSEPQGRKFKPMPNPGFIGGVMSENDQRPVVGARTSSLLLTRQQDESKPSSLNQQQTTDEEEEEEKEYHRRMPRPPPKDEKWVISSIRRPQQLPVRTNNARMFDGSSSISRNSGIATPVETSPANIAEAQDNEQQHQPKVHRPVIPLTIDIPNSFVKPTPELPQNAAQQVIEQARRASQMSPIQQKMNLNYQQPGYAGDNDNGIRPAPWNENGSSAALKTNNFRPATPPASGNGYYNGYQPNAKPSNQDLAQFQLMQQQQQQQQQQFDEENKKRLVPNKKNGKEEPSNKSANVINKDNKGRFSLGFFMGGGNKKEKKKEKEAAAAAVAASSAVNYGIPNQNDMGNMYQSQQYMSSAPPQQRPLSQQYPHESDVKSSHSSINNHRIQSPSSQQQQSQHQTFDGSRYLGYAKAQWPFEATIEGEMSFHAEEVIGILRKQTDGWWEAERLEPNAAGQRGLVPGNYMIEAIAPLP